MDPKKAPVEALRAVIAETQSAQFDLMMMIDRLEARPGGAETDIDATRQIEAGLHKLYVRLGRILFRGEEGIPTFDENGMLDAPINEVIDGDSSARPAVTQQ
jgi:hypothetical protein